jgi:hypothetical protein
MDTDVFSQIVERAASDQIFRQQLIADLDRTLDAEGYVVPGDDKAVLGEYCRAAAAMSEDELAEAIRGYYSSGKDARKGG